MHHALSRLAGAALAALAALAADAAGAWGPRSLLSPCEGDCAVAIYGGTYVDDSMDEVLVTAPETPFTWDYDTDDRLLAATVSRRAAEWRRLAFEPEAGVAQRFGRQSATEVWGAVFARYHGFPWDGTVLTTVAVSAGLNWASEITEVERERARDGEGAQWLFYFSPEVTFALPNHPEVELMFRFHHRSGVFGLVSDAWGGSHYGTVGLRLRF